MTLKIKSRSPKPNQLFTMSQCYIHANLVKIHPPVHEISCKQESVMPTPTGSAPKTICPLPFSGGHNQRKSENGRWNFPRPSLHQRQCWTWGSISGLLACQADMLPIELLCPAGWSESSLDAQIILLLLSCCGSSRTFQTYQYCNWEPDDADSLLKTVTTNKLC